MPTILPMMSCAAVACQTPRQTSQLHMMPRTSVAPHGADVCAEGHAEVRDTEHVYYDIPCASIMLRGAAVCA